VAGAGAGVTSSLLNFPLDVLHVRLAGAPSGTYNGLVDCARKVCFCCLCVYFSACENEFFSLSTIIEIQFSLVDISKHSFAFSSQTLKYEGIGGLYKGLVPSLCGVVPLVGTNLSVYESLKRFYADMSDGEPPGVGALLACGATSSICGTSVSYPFALVRTRLQVTLVNRNRPRALLLFDFCCRVSRTHWHTRSMVSSMHRHATPVPRARRTSRATSAARCCTRFARSIAPTASPASIAAGRWRFSSRCRRCRSRLCSMK
jgi:hypothetical protein